MTISKGYEKPIQSLKDDSLGRQRIAKQIAQTLIGLDDTWSVRVGLYGGWGEGKTSVVNLVKCLVKDEGHLFCSFSPWDCDNIQDWWVGLVEIIIAELEANKHDLKTINNLKTKLKAHKAKRYISFIPEAAGACFPGGKALVGAISQAGDDYLKKYITISDEELTAIHSLLKGKRIIIAIDDLDRCNPSIIPNLLLSLREILDKPKLSFLLAFDDEIISKALVQQHRAWGKGEKFLEKIVDFKFHLDPLGQKEKQTLVNAHRTTMPELLGDHFPDLIDALPSNPRRLKSFFRHFDLLEVEVKRHNKEEVNWYVLCLLLIIKMDSNKLVDKIFNEIVLNDEVIQNSMFRKENDEDLKEKAFTQLIKDESNNNCREAIAAFKNALESTRDNSVRYARDFLFSPHDITWKEYDDLLTAYGCDMVDMVSWISGHAAKMSSSPEVVLDELVKITFSMIKSRLYSAADALLLKQHNEHIISSIGALNFLKDLITAVSSYPNLVINTQHILSELVDLSCYWRNFRTNEYDIKARNEEEAMLLWLLPRVNGGLVSLYGKILDTERSFPSERDNMFTEKNATFFHALEESAINEVFFYFYESSKYSKIKELEGEYYGATQLIFSPDSALQKKHNLENLVRQMKAQDSVKVQLALFEFFKLLRERLFSGTIGLTKEQIQEVVRNEGYILPLWEFYIQEPLNFRFHHDLLKTHNCITEHINYELPIPDWIDS